MPQRPNILYIFTDQQSGAAMSCAGNPDLATPAMDRLASAGTRFDLAYCTQPLCTPSRASMFTGRMPHECKTPRNGQSIAEDLRPFELGRVFQQAGYDCFYGGKWHVPQIAMPPENDHGFRVFAGFNDRLLTGACIDTLRAWAGQPAHSRQPFLMVASFDNPHNICEWARNMPLPWGEIGAPPPPRECPNLPPNFAPAPFEPEIVRVEQACNWVIYPYRLRAPEDWRQLRWAYFRLVEKVDRELGRILDALAELGLQDDTVVVFSSDHGDGHGAHQWNQKSALFEEVVRIPLIVRAPGGKSGVCDHNHLVSNGLDLLPTLCDYAGICPPPGLRGGSLRPLVEGREPPAAWRDSLVVETIFDGGRGYDTAGRALRTRQHKYVLYDRGRYREQLFDMERDPGEIVNLAVESRHQELLNDCRRRLAAALRETGDPFKVPAPEPGRDSMTGVQ
ncbi:MAG: hypothetical protein A3K19_17765 [Lentisphaerae bacterium RIFOXYB12_FULL_65_16]|nr:MAG: hypothetical protein A3K18_15000 [Lentisphaerae bacterium RIFOXYA12_64_32]OGV85296.1 MAG: hypothetical protein A3K19_17765 [Lentisphaerae bacterium RIFOXYB12_FULL_65_16]